MLKITSGRTLFLRGKAYYLDGRWSHWAARFTGVVGGSRSIRYGRILWALICLMQSGSVSHFPRMIKETHVTN